MVSETQVFKIGSWDMRWDIMKIVHIKRVALIGSSLNKLNKMSAQEWKSAIKYVLFVISNFTSNWVSYYLC